MAKVSGELTAIQPPRQANSDARTLARYLQAIGVETTADRLNELLVLLAVVMIEAGGGLSLAVGMALSGGRSVRDRAMLAGATVGAGGGLSGTLPPTPAINALPAPIENRAAAGRTGQAGTLPLTVGSGARERLLGMLQGGQGVVRGCQAEIGRAIGVSRARVRQLLGDLSAARVIRVRTSPSGTVISLIEARGQRVSMH